MAKLTWVQFETGFNSRPGLYLRKYGFFSVNFFCDMHKTVEDAAAYFYATEC